MVNRLSPVTYRQSLPKDKKRKIIFIVGPTGIGKTETAIHLAKKINLEIVSCDSMQIYREMDILTSKPSLTLRKKVRHHLIDTVSPTKDYDVLKYRQEALKKIKEIILKQKIPLFVGGSGLYMSVVLDGIFKMKTPDRNIRKELYQQAEDLGSAYLYNKLRDVDPVAASKIHPNDTKRIIRGLEVFEVTGKPISYWQKQRSGISDKYDVRIFCLNLPRDRLYKRIEERIERMFKQGLLEEVRKLLRLKLSKTASYAIGIKELKGYFAGLYDLEEAKRLMKRNTRLYAKRQLTWFRKDKRIEWIEISDADKPKKIADKILCKI